MARVVLENLRKVYDNDHVAVAGASFEVADGELLVLVGPSGCGKSTLLRMVAGLETITAGSLRIDDRVVNTVSPKDRDIAMVFQNYALYPHMSVAGNLGFGLKLRGQGKAEIAGRVSRAAAMLGLDQVLERRPAMLSGGQRQRVALGRALVRDPKVFLLDEPLSNLDAKLRQSMRVEIARLHRRLGATMLYVTHDQVEAMTLGQRIVVLKDGEIQQIDTPMALYREPANLFVAGFLGNPAMNFFHGRLVADPSPHLDMGAASLPLSGLWLGGSALSPYLHRKIVVGIRPEHVRWQPQPGQPPAPDNRITATLDIVEMVGSEAYANLAFADTAVIVRLPVQTMPAPGASMPLGYSTADLHFFDQATGLRIA